MAAMSGGEDVAGGRTGAPPLVLVLVAAVDRRMLPALALAPWIRGAEVRAVHVAVDADAAHDVARDWMRLDITWPPLHIEEPCAEAETLADCVRSVVAREAACRPWVTVLVPELDLDRWWQPLLHRGTGRAIAWELAGLPNVTAAVLPMPIERGGRASRLSGAGTRRRDAGLDG